MPRISNLQMVEELKAGDRLGCIHLVETYRKKLILECTNAFRMNVLDAEEVVDDVLLSIIRKIGQFSFKKTESDFHFWIMKIFRNKLKDFVRRRVAAGRSGPLSDSLRSNECSLETEEVGLILAAIRSYERSVLEAERSAPSNRVLACIVEALDDMEPWEQTLLRCRALEVPYSDIARYTGKKANLLKVYHARVKKKFVRLMMARHPELGESVGHETFKEKTILPERIAVSAR